MYTVNYAYQISQFVSIHREDEDVVQYGTIRQINCVIFLNSSDEMVEEIEYLVELYGSEKCPKMVSATESELTPSPMPVTGG